MGESANSNSMVERVAPPVAVPAEMVPADHTVCGYEGDVTPKKPKLWMTWSCDTPEGISLAMQCDFGNHGLAGDFLDQPFECKGIMVKESSGVDRVTGEIKTYPMTVFLLADGSTRMSGSEGVWKGIPYVVRFMGDGAWKKTCWLKVCARKGTGGSKWYYLLLCSAPEKSETKKGGK